VSPRSAAVETHVTDHGLGFPGPFLAAFDQFTRPDGARTGTRRGLALSSVSALARAAADHAHVTNCPDRGTHVWITIPTTHDPATMTVCATDGNT
jgi:signal transduction histidine kinase